MSEKLKNNKRLVVSSIIILVLVIGALLWYFLIYKANDIRSGQKNALLYPTVVFTDNINSNKANRGTKIEITGHIAYLGSKAYWYRSDFYYEGGLIKNGVCRKVTTKDYISLGFPLSLDKMYAKVGVYKDSKCNIKVAAYKTKTYYINNPSNTNNNKRKTFIATFKKNGASSIGAERLSCTTTGTSCTVKAPSITAKSGYSIVGWNDITLVSSAKYKVGSTITLSSNKTFYAIVKKNVTKPSNNPLTKGSIDMTIFTDTFKAGTSGTIKVTTTPSSATATVTSSNPNVIRITKTGNTWKMTAVKAGTATVIAQSSTGAKKSKTYKVVEPTENKHAWLKKGLASEMTINGVKVYIEKGCNASAQKSHITDIKETPVNLLKYSNGIYLLSSSTFKSVWGGNYSGMTYAGNVISYNAINCGGFYYGTVAHELAHSIDSKYGFASGKIRLSSSKEYINLYNKYKGKNVLRSYAFSNPSEFFSESFSAYVLQTYYKTNTYSKAGKWSSYPTDIKSQMKNTVNTVSNFALK